MQLLIDPHGQVRCLYSEAIELHTLGVPAIRRASHVEPDGCGRWWADLGPVGGPRLGPFDRRSDALAGEVAWLEHWLAQPSSVLNLNQESLHDCQDRRQQAGH